MVLYNALMHTVLQDNNVYFIIYIYNLEAKLSS